MSGSVDRDVLGMSPSDRVWAFVLLGGGGALLLGILPWLLDLLAGFPFIPFGDVVDWLGSFDQWWAPLLRIGLGLLAGVVLALLTIWDEHRLEVGEEDIVVLHGDDRRTLRRDQVVGIHRDGKKVTIDGDQGRVLFSQKLEAGRDDVRSAFVSREWPWESD
ncbi:hypothetical protein ACHAAC_16315 [Aeromicrobium sp. CF4.19]|uniref:YqeB family protein n=1 Tax=Aeromicrobium sp. CF4.19 TaxID=3373082 RepID=UPI003EE5AD02